MLEKTEENLKKLFLEAQDGNRDSYQLFLKEAGELLERSLRKYISGGDLEDVVQETLLAIHHARHTYHSSRPLFPWIFAIGKNRAIDHLRKINRKNEIQLMESDFDVTLESSEELELNMQTLMNGLGQLPEKQKFIVEQMKLKDRSVKDVARELKLSESAVKVAASRAYEKLRIWMLREKK